MDFKELLSKLNTIEGCGDMPMNMPSPQQPPSPPPTMSVNLNAQGVDNIEDMISLIKKMAGHDQPPMPTMSLPPIKMLPSISDKPKMLGMDKEREEGFQDATTEPDPEYKDTDYMVNKLAGGLNKPQQMHKHGYKQNDNPLAMDSVEKIRESLANLYQEYKAK